VGQVRKLMDQQLISPPEEPGAQQQGRVGHEPDRRFGVHHFKQLYEQLIQIVEPSKLSH